jgi:hypothetical protein
MALLANTRRLFAAALLLIVAGCTPNAPEATPSTAPPPTIDRWGGLLQDLRELWNAEPGIDLLTGPAVIVRAYRESIELAQSMGKNDYVYPGFARAVLPSEPNSEQMSKWDRWPTLATPVTEARFGNLKSHILTIARSGRDVAAVVCSYTYATATENGTGKFVSRGKSSAGTNPGISAYYVKMLAPEQETRQARPPQKGPSPAPVTDVFGEWKITGSLNSVAYIEADLIHEWPSYHDDLAACVNKAPDPPERRQFLLTGEHPRSEFPTLPAEPGWPSVTN